MFQHFLITRFNLKKKIEQPIKKTLQF